MSFKVMSIPGKNIQNPYIRLFYDALLPFGVYAVEELPIDFEIIKSEKDTFDAIHLHWPEILWRNYLNRYIKQLRYSNVKGTWRLSRIIEELFKKRFKNESVEKFLELLEFLKKNNKKIIWTWHNYQPHEKVDFRDFIGYQILAENADLIIFHSQLSQEHCTKEFKISAKTVVMAHGNYDNTYPAARKREVVLEELGLDPSKPVVGCLGGMRNYKGLDVACKALEILNGSVQFICAGNPHPLFDLDTIRNRLSGQKHVVLISKMISDQEFSDYAKACDILLFPYNRITGSGALLAGLTFGRGVIASDLPFFHEVLKNKTNAGRLFAPGNAYELSKMIISYLKTPEIERENASLSLAGEYAWPKVIIPVATKMKDLGWC